MSLSTAVEWTQRQHMHTQGVRLHKCCYSVASAAYHSRRRPLCIPQSQVPAHNTLSKATVPCRPLLRRACPYGHTSIHVHPVQSGFSVSVDMAPITPGFPPGPETFLQSNYERRHLPLAPDLSPVLLTLLSPSRVIAPPHALPPCTTASPTAPSLLALASPKQTRPRSPVLCSPLGFRAAHEQATVRIPGRAGGDERVSQHLVARGHVTAHRCAGERACGVR
jgi:hypothetical protein